jgi:hypothetical protein
MWLSATFASAIIRAKSRGGDVNALADIVIVQVPPTTVRGIMLCNTGIAMQDCI